MRELWLFVLLVQTVCLYGTASAEWKEEDIDLRSILSRLNKLEKRVEVLETENKALKSENEDIKTLLSQLYNQKQSHSSNIWNGTNESNVHHSSIKKEESIVTTRIHNKAKVIKEDVRQKNEKKRLLVSGTAPEVAVAFRASLSKAIPSVGDHQVIDYDNVQLNLGNAYDARHGHFTAPVKGLYLIMANVFAESNKRVVLEMVKNGNRIGAFDTGHHTSYISEWKSLPIVLEQNDMVWLRTYPNYAGEYVPGYGENSHNMFAGVLITTL